MMADFQTCTTATTNGVRWLRRHIKLKDEMLNKSQVDKRRLILLVEKEKGILRKL
jgi:hypothetical protein